MQPETETSGTDRYTDPLHSTHPKNCQALQLRSTFLLQQEAIMSFVQTFRYIPYSREQKHVSVSNTPCYYLNQIQLVTWGIKK